jgi:hypothetical protein
MIRKILKIHRQHIGTVVVLSIILRPVLQQKKSQPHLDHGNSNNKTNRKAVSKVLD